jgi:[ribosomal protein S5]-alanine N-acetyltransferase
MLSHLPITSSSLTIRAFTMADVSKVFQMSQEKGMRQWIADQVYHDEAQTTDVLKFLKSQYHDDASPAISPCVLGVCLRSTNELIGHVGLSPAKDGVEIGYAIAEAHQGRGYATEAVTAMALWGHKAFGLPKILGIVAADNVGSCRVLEKSGFVFSKEHFGKMHEWEGVIKTYERLF